MSMQAMCTMTTQAIDGRCILRPIELPLSGCYAHILHLGEEVSTNRRSLLLNDGKDDGT
jgi:hypothetical protein